jgi:hypothetical protein
MITENAYILKTRTDNGRLAKTLIFMPSRKIIVINRRILLKVEDIEDGRFSNAKPIFIYKDYVLLEEQMVFYTDSFDLICESVAKLKKV